MGGYLCKKRSAGARVLTGLNGILVCLCMCVVICMKERAREGEYQRDQMADAHAEGVQDFVRACVCVCVYACACKCVVCARTNGIKWLMLMDEESRTSPSCSLSPSFMTVVLPSDSNSIFTCCVCLVSV